MPVRFEKKITSVLYESLIFLSWSLSSIHFVLEYTTKNKFIGALISPTTLFINSFALFNVPNEMQKITPLIPALKSNWLMMHVTIMLLSYAILFAGTLLSISFLILNDIQFRSSDLSKATASNSNKQTENPSLTPYSQEFNYQFYLMVNKQEILKNLDNLSYRLISLGFAFLTIGILSGAIWANEAWGSYWSWDPKETWALITWISFAIYLHTRLIRGWSGKRPALVASIGFIVLWICYLGVNILGKGLHSYGWFF